VIAKATDMARGPVEMTSPAEHLVCRSCGAPASFTRSETVNAVVQLDNFRRDADGSLAYDKGEDEHEDYYKQYPAEYSCNACGEVDEDLDDLVVAESEYREDE
jgi:hypothetical protein